MTAHQDPAPPCVPVCPLTPAAFARFGDVLAHHGPARRTHYPRALQAVAASPHPTLWVSRVTVAQALPLRINRMERHRRAAGVERFLDWAAAQQGL